MKSDTGGKERQALRLRSGRRPMRAAGFRGGQGRSAEEVEASALLGGVALLGVIAILVIFWACGLLGG